MNATSLPGGAQHAACRRFQSFMRIRDHQFHATQTATDQAFQEGGPKCLRFRWPYMQTHDFSFAVCGYCHSDYHRDGPYLSALALLEVGGVQPEIWPIADKRAVEEDVHSVVDVLAQLAYRALADPGQPHRLHQFVDTPGRHAADPSLLDHGYQGLLGRFPGLEEGREIAALPQLGDAQLQAAQARIKRSVAIAVAIRRTVDRPLMTSGADQPVNICLHQQLHHGLRHTAKKSPSPAFARSSASGSLSSVIGSSSVRVRASQLHLSQTIRWPPPPTPEPAENLPPERGRYPIRRPLFLRS